jgi:hypothetical protein
VTIKKLLCEISIEQRVFQSIRRESVRVNRECREEKAL